MEAPGRSVRPRLTAVGTRLVLVTLLPLLLLVGGTAGYRLIEGWSVFDALYMSVITLTTVGFGEVHPLSR